MGKDLWWGEVKEKLPFWEKMGEILREVREILRGFRDIGRELRDIGRELRSRWGRKWW